MIIIDDTNLDLPFLIHRRPRGFRIALGGAVGGCGSVGLCRGRVDGTLQPGVRALCGPLAQGPGSHGVSTHAGQLTEADLEKCGEPLK